MSWKQWVTGYLTFSRKDRIGLITLVFLIITVFVLPYFAPSSVEVPVVLNDSMLIAIDSAQSNRNPGYTTEKRNNSGFNDKNAPAFTINKNAKAALFAFDPNTLDADGWMKLGLQEKTIRTILNYRNKGGRFYKPEDLQKIWGLPEGFYKHVAAYIRIPRKEDGFNDRSSFAAHKENENNKPKGLDINTADTSAWIALPGIGSKLAGRIVNFRNKLGGFTSIEQVGTTYGLADSTFQKIKSMLRLNTAALIKINLNQATKEQLSAHPYINWKLANAIVAYREQHGFYASVEDLKKIMILDEETFKKLHPYLDVQ